ncbi:MAG: transcription termination/antitermination protein NusA [Deltaproteobacteria bacterium]|nr:transcription termination/antitermination protein NusA [Deltaproteobacteria bacterium]
MELPLGRVIEQVSKEKQIDRDVVIEAVESAMVQAARKMLGAERQIEAKFNPDIGEVELFEIKRVVDEVVDPLTEITLEMARRDYDEEAEVGDEFLAKLPRSDFGRIGAQAAKQAIIQKVRDAEREIIYNEFKDRKGEIFSGIVQRFERKNIIVNLGRTDAILPEREQIPRERYRQGDRIRAYIYDVDLTAKGPQIVLSRTHPNLLIELFRQEVPEIYEGIVEVKAAVREPGGRAKIAVVSHDRDVDPVGACVGMRGTRVQAVVQELRGEKIDIIHWTADPAEFVCRGLAPAKVSKIILDEDDHAMEVIVPDDQLSLAIGKKGQNVTLASRLTGWRLDVRGESEADEEVRQSRASLTSITGVSDVTAELLMQHGFKSAEEVAQSDAEAIAEVEGIGPERAVGILDAARRHVEERRVAAEAAAREAAALEASRLAAAEAAESDSGADVDELSAPSEGSDDLASGALDAAEEEKI